MDTNQIIALIDAEIARLQQVQSILSDTASTKQTTHKKLRRPANESLVIAAPVAAKRILSPEARARIVAAQKARWAKVNKVKKAA